MRDRTRAVLTCVAVLGAAIGLATEARADLAYATTGASVSTTTGATITSGGNNVTAVDGVLLTVNTDATAIGGTPSVNGQTFVLTVNFPANSTGGNTDLTIVTGTVDSGVTLTSIRWFDASAFTATKAVNVAMSANSVNRVVTANDLTTYTLSNVAFLSTGINRVDLTFAFTGFVNNGNLADNQRIQFDAISNPEPGTIALFGLGALGLGAMTLRRRKAKARAATA